MSLGVYSKNIAPRQSWRVLLDTASKFALFSMSGLKDENIDKEQAYIKTEKCNSFLESFEYFC